MDLLERDAASRRLYKSEGLHHLADVGEHLIWRPLGVNLRTETKLPEKPSVSRRAVEGLQQTDDLHVCCGI